MGNCLNAEFIADASIPDGTVIKAGHKVRHRRLLFNLCTSRIKFTFWALDFTYSVKWHVFKFRLRKFFLNNFSLSRNVSSLKIGIFLLSFIWSCVKQVVISLPLKQIRRMSELSGFVYIKSYGALHVNSKAQKVNYSMMRYLVSEPWWNLPASKNCIKLTALRQWLNKPSRKKFKRIDEFSV